MRQSWARSGAGANDLLALTNTSNVDEIQRTFNEYWRTRNTAAAEFALRTPFC